MTAPRTLDLGDGLTLPVSVVTHTVGIVGQKRTGKTSTAVVVVEEAARAGAVFVVIDPTGAWRGLNRAGAGPALDCIVMGRGGDVALSADAGRAVSTFVVEEGHSVVCTLKAMPRSEQVRFVADLCEELLTLGGRRAVTVIIDEAPRFVPQAGAGIEEDGPRCRVAVTEIVTLGGVEGIGSVLIAQRPSAIHKDVFEQAETLIIHRLKGNNDRKAIAGWLEEAGAEHAASMLTALPNLRQGQALVLASEYDIATRATIRPKQTLDTSDSPDVGAVLLEAPPGDRPTLDLAALEAKMGAAIAKAEENDPAALKRKVERLERQIADGGGADVEELRAACARIADLEADLAVASERADALRGFQNAVKLTIAEHTPGARRLLSELAAIDARDLISFVSDDGAARGAPTGEEGVHSVAAPVRPAQGGRARDSGSNGDGRAPSSPPAGGGNAAAAGSARAQPAVRTSIDREPPPADPARQHVQADLVAGARRMLDALRRYQSLTRAELSTLANSFGGSMRTNLSTLKTVGYVAEDGGRVSLTSTGALVAGAPAPPWTPDEVIAKHSGKLVAGARRVLGVVMRGGPTGGFTRAELERLADSKGGSFRTNLSKLKTLGLVEERNRRVYPGHVLYADRIASR